MVADQVSWRVIVGGHSFHPPNITSFQQGALVGTILLHGETLRATHFLRTYDMIWILVEAKQCGAFKRAATNKQAPRITSGSF